eukprot:877802-Prymnesium_polylepis.1
MKVALVWEVAMAPSIADEMVAAAARSGATMTAVTTMEAEVMVSLMADGSTPATAASWEV